MSQIEQAKALVLGFVQAVPEASPVLSLHLEDNFDELLPHVFMADLTRWIIGLQRKANSGDAEAGATRDRALAYLERRFSDPQDLGAHDVIAASFVENLHQAGDVLPQLLDRLGPTLKTALPQRS